ncbi:MAG: hypothetical protein HRU40_22420, partial [Saprospiraceae bacterium]|nr:hypothetical protein [Saprospiraceae bacterium]
MAQLIKIRSGIIPLALLLTGACNESASFESRKHAFSVNGITCTSKSHADLQAESVKALKNEDYKLAERIQGCLSSLNTADAETKYTLAGLKLRNGKSKDALELFYEIERKADLETQKILGALASAQIGQLTNDSRRINSAVATFLLEP